MCIALVLLLWSLASLLFYRNRWISSLRWGTLCWCCIWITTHFRQTLKPFFCFVRMNKKYRAILPQDNVIKCVRLCLHISLLLFSTMAAAETAVLTVSAFTWTLTAKIILFEIAFSTVLRCIYIYISSLPKIYINSNCWYCVWLRRLWPYDIAETRAEVVLSCLYQPFNTRYHHAYVHTHTQWRYVVTHMLHLQTKSVIQWRRKALKWSLSN